MSFLIQYQYVILYFSGAFFSFFAMISYVKFGNSFVGGKKKLDSPEDFFSDFDNEDLEALLDESFDTAEDSSFTKTADTRHYIQNRINFASENLDIVSGETKTEEISGFKGPKAGKRESR